MGRKETGFFLCFTHQKPIPNSTENEPLNPERCNRPLNDPTCSQLLFSFASILSGPKFTGPNSRLRTIKPTQQQHTPAAAYLGREQPPARL